MEEEYIRMMGEPASESFVVKGVRLDDLLPQMNDRIDFVKIDVEGAEPLVFEGARNTLIVANSDLTIITEWSPGQIRAAGSKVPAFLAALKAMGLRSYDIAPHGLVSVLFERSPEYPIPDRHSSKKDRINFL